MTDILGHSVRDRHRSPGPRRTYRVTRFVIDARSWQASPWAHAAPRPVRELGVPKAWADLARQA